MKPKTKSFKRGHYYFIGLFSLLIIIGIVSATTIGDTDIVGVSLEKAQAPFIYANVTFNQSYLLEFFGSRFVNRTGDTMTGDLEMTGATGTITTSFFDGIAGHMDIRGNPWYLDIGFWALGDIISSANIYATNFYGNYNWTTSDNWNTFTGSHLSFNESKLATIYYNATQSNINEGTIDAGRLFDTQHQDGNYDGITFNFSEQAGSPALDMKMNFTDVVGFNGGVIRYKTSALAGEYPIIQLWSYTDLAWEDYPAVAESLTFATITQPVFDDTEHLQDGVVQMRLYKASNGNTNNHYYIDWVAISKGFGTPSGEEVDALSWHRNNTNEEGDYYTSGNITAQSFQTPRGRGMCENATALIITGNLTYAYETWGCE